MEIGEPFKIRLTLSPPFDAKIWNAFAVQDENYGLQMILDGTNNWMDKSVGRKYVSEFDLQGIFPNSIRLAGVFGQRLLILVFQNAFF